jgi:hypothetical protein
MDMEEELVEVKVQGVVVDMEVMQLLVVEEGEVEVAEEVVLKVVDMVEELEKVVGKDMVEVQHMVVVMLVAVEVAVVEVEVVVQGVLVVVMEVVKEVEQEVDMVENMEEDTVEEVEVEVVEEVVLVGLMEADMVVVKEQVVDTGVGQQVVVVVSVVALAVAVEGHMVGDMVVVLEVAKVAATADIILELPMKFNVMKEYLAPLTI